MDTADAVAANAATGRSAGVSAWLLCLVFAAACSGGGGSAPPALPMPPEPPPFPRTASDPPGFVFPTLTPDEFAAAKRPYEQSPEYRVRYTSGGASGADDHLAQINAAAAYARGATGAGETVVIADSGFFSEHREFSGRGKFTLVASFGDECTDEELRLQTCSDDNHGTSTAGTAAGVRHNLGAGDSLNMHGVAFDANIRGIRVRLGAGGRTTHRVLPSLLGYDESGDIAFYERLLYQPVDASLPEAERTYDRSRPWGFVFNLSFGTFHGIASYTRSEIRAAFPRLAALFAQAQRPAADRSIIVWSAGNNQGRNYDLDLNDDGILDTNERGQGDPIDATAPTLETALGVHFPELLGHVLSVVAVRQDGLIAGFSNRCGIARDFCIAAPGVAMIAPQRGLGALDSAGAVVFPTDSYRLWGGTSAAAPVVSGALAVLRSFFKNPDGSYALGNTELVTRLLATADRSDNSASGGPDYSDSDTYGQGLLDLDAATRPVGELSTAMHGAGDAGGMGLDTVGAAFGASFAQRIGGAALALYDELNAPFFQPAGNWLRRPGPRGGGAVQNAGVTRAGIQSGAARFAFAARRARGAVPGLAPRFAPESPRQWLDGALLALGGGDTSWWAGWNAASVDAGGRGAQGEAAFSGGALAAPFFSFVGDGPGAGFSRSTGGGHIAWSVQHGAPLAGGRALDAGWKSGTAAALRWRPGKTPLALHLGVVRERDGFLGARATGAMGRTKSTTAFAGAGVNWRSGKWRGHASAFLGATDPQTTPGMLREVSDLRSDAFSITATRRGLVQRGDRFSVTLAQPLRIRSGEAVFRFAAGRTRYGEMIYRRHRVNLEPSGRAMELTAAWQGSLRGGDLRLAVRATRRPNHDAAAGVVGEGWVSFRKQF